MDFVFDPSLVLYLPLYQLDGASFVSKDAYGHKCTVTGALWRPNGRWFDGTDDYLSLGTSFVPLGAKTIMLWFRTEDNDTQKSLLNDNAVGSSGYGTDMNISGGNLGCTLAVGVGGNTNYTVEIAVSNDTWYLGTLTWDGTTGANKVILYLDGTAEDTDTADTTETTAPSSALFIGRHAISATDYNHIGDIGEVWIYNRALTPLEIQNIYLATKWRYR